MVSRVRRCTPQAIRRELADRTHDLDIEMEVLKANPTEVRLHLRRWAEDNLLNYPPGQPSGDLVGTTLVGLHVDISALQVQTKKTVSDTPRQSPIDLGEWKGVDKSFDGEPVRFR